MQERSGAIPPKVNYQGYYSPKVVLETGDAKMRSISYATLALASLFVAAPLAGAYASMSDDHVSLTQPPAASAPHEKVILNQLNSVMDGITADRAGGQLTAAQASSMEADAHNIRKETIAASAHGQMSNASYDQLLSKLGQLSEQVNPRKVD
jgi:hypothetical protein